MTWIDRKLHRVDGGHGIAEVADGVIYLAISLRNAGAGMAVLQSWCPLSEFAVVSTNDHAPLQDFRAQTRDIYIAPNDVGVWQGAVRERSDPVFDAIAARITERERFLIEVLYVNAEGGQRTISRFVFAPSGDDGWLCSVGRHFSLDHDLPR